MTSALFQRKVPLHPVLFSLEKKLGWGEELEKKRRKTILIIQSFQNDIKETSKSRHGQFFMCETGSVILSSLCSADSQAPFQS